MTLSRGERFEDARRKAKKSMDVVASETGLSKSMIQALEDDGKDRDVGYSNIAKLAACYDVSADFLLGLSDIPSMNITTREIGKVTGLSESAIKRLLKFNNSDLESHDSVFNAMLNFKTMQLLNSFLEHRKLKEFMVNLYAAIKYSEFQIPEDATGKDLIDADHAAACIGGIVLQRGEAVRHFRQEALNALRDIVYDMVPEQEDENNGNSN